MARPRGDIDVRIARAARGRFLHDGVDGASLRAIARDAGTSIGMVYYYHRTKDDLFLAVVEQVYAGLLAELADLLARPLSVPQRIEALYARLARLSDDELTVLRLILREALVSSERRARLLARFARGHLPLIGALLVEGRLAGAVTDRHPVPVLAIATMVLAVMPQIVRRLVGDGLPPGVVLPAPDALARALVDVLLHGLAEPRRA